MSRKNTQVLVVGAGPAGLTSACELVRRGARVRIVDALPEPSGLSRAVLLWPPTLRVLDGLGVLAEAWALGTELRRAVFHSFGRPVVPLDLTARGAPLLLRQPDTERLLSDALARHGVAVEYGTQVTDVGQSEDRVQARLLVDGVRAHAEADWLIGADGMYSTVRRSVGIRFPGDLLTVPYLLAEGRLDGDVDPLGAHYFTGPSGILGVIPLPDGRFRVSGALAEGAGEPDAALTQDLLDRRGPGGLRFADPTWISEFQVHRRLADRFRAGRIFLVGDAAHVNPPLGGQGLNLAMQDAHNLGWKLAEVQSGRAAPELLDGYEPERRHAARAAVHTTSLGLNLWIRTSTPARRIRDALFGVLRVTGLLARVYEPVYSERRLRYPNAGRSLRPCAIRALLRSADGTGMRLSNALDAAAYGAFDPTEQRMILLTVYADTDPRLVRAAARYAAAYPASLVHRDVPRERMLAASGTSADPRCRRPGYYLIRPDRIVAAHGHGADLSVVRSLLRVWDSQYHH